LDKKVSTKVSTTSRNGFSKTDVRYWLKAVHQNSRTRNGTEARDRHFSVKICYKGRRETFALFSNKQQSAAQARDIYFSLTRDGWNVTLEKFKPRAIQPASTATAAQGEIVTVGDLLKAASEVSSAASRSTYDYCSAFRRIVAQIFGIDDPKKRVITGGRDRWRKRVDAIRMSEVTPERIVKWKKDYLAKAAEGGLAAQRHAKVSVNSTLRNAKALFSAKIRPLLNLELPYNSPFVGVQFEQRQSARYRSDIDVGTIIALAHKGSKDGKLRPLPKEQMKMFLLAVMAGLRRREIDLLEWSSFRFDEKLIRLQPTRWFTAKTEESYGDVQVSPRFMETFRRYKESATGDFVVESPCLPKLNLISSTYRCNEEFRRLVKWLRAAGINTNAPLHTLRKEFGSQVNAEFGIYAAKQQLRHADITLTSAVYVAPKQEMVPTTLSEFLGDPS